MAEGAANFSFTYQNKPSIFEVLAESSLKSTLYPAFQKLALFLSNNFPSKFAFLNQYGDETFLTFNALVEWYYLKYYDSSFSENFYGLKRVLFNGSSLPDQNKKLSLIFLIIFPYMKRKIDEKLQIYRIQAAEGSLGTEFEGRCKNFLIHIYATSECLWNLTMLKFYFQYISGKSDCQHPILRVLNMKLVYSSDEPSTSFWSMLFTGNLKFSEINSGLVRNAISTVLEVSAFFLQFLHARNSQRPNINYLDFPKIEAPQSDNRSEVYQGKCPICLQKWLIPTVLPVSGYIFCFRCILRHLNETQKCPVTNLPARPLDVVRIYDQDL